MEYYSALKEGNDNTRYNPDVKHAKWKPVTKKHVI